MKPSQLLLLAPLAVLLTGVACSGQKIAVQAAGQTSERPPVRVFQIVPSAEMGADDRVLMDGQWSGLVEKAALFGYSVDKPGWTYEQVITPVAPDYVMLKFEHPRQGLAHGPSVFTAFVERAGGHVWIVPVLYGGGAPWHPAISQERSRLVFNRVVPRELARRAFHDGGMWLALGQTYAEMVGYHPEVLVSQTEEMAVMRAPEPTAFSGDEKFMRSVEFSDLRTASGYRLWTVSFDFNGRVTKAEVRQQAPTEPAIASKAEGPTQTFRNLPAGQTIIQHPKPIPW